MDKDFGIFSALMVLKLLLQHSVALTIVPRVSAELDSTETTYQLCKTSVIKKAVQAGRAKLLNPDGTVKERKKTEVSA